MRLRVARRWAYRGECIAPARPARKRLASHSRKTGYNRCMSIALFAMRLAEVMFFVGLLGSAVVVLISFVEDAKELFEKD